MEQSQRTDVERVSFAFGFLLKKEGDNWVALCPEINVASQGSTVDDAREGLKDAVETYVLYMLEEGRQEEIARPVSQGFIQDFLADPPGECTYECYVLVVSWVREAKLFPSVEFLRAPFCPVPISGHMAA